MYSKEEDFWFMTVVESVSVNQQAICHSFGIFMIAV